MSKVPVYGRKCKYAPLVVCEAEEYPSETRCIPCLLSIAHDTLVELAKHIKNRLRAGLPININYIVYATAVSRDAINGAAYLISKHFLMEHNEKLSDELRSVFENLLSTSKKNLDEIVYLAEKGKYP